MIITFILTVVITSIITVVIILTFYKNTENTIQVNTEDNLVDMQPPQMDDELDNSRSQRDVTMRNNPSYEMTILNTEV